MLPVSAALTREVCGCNNIYRRSSSRQLALGPSRSEPPALLPPGTLPRGPAHAEALRGGGGWFWGAASWAA